MSENSGGSHCKKLSDAEIMRMKIEDTFCHERSDFIYSEIHPHLVEKGVQVQLVNLIEYCNWLSSCQRCRFYNGEYPTWGEIKNQF